MKLVFHLFDEVVTDFTGVFLEGKLGDGEDCYEPLPLREPNDDIEVFLQYNKPGRPSWIDFFEAHCDFGDRRPVNRHNSLVVVFRIHPRGGDRFLALTAGQGHLALDKSLVEDGFGLTVTLNAVNPVRLRGMEARDLGTRTQQKKLAVTYESEVWEFAYDPDTEVVGALSGVPADENFADQVSGSDSLALFRHVKWKELLGICDSLFEAYNKRDYEQRFKFLANQRQVRNRQQRTILDNLLQEAIAARRTEKVALAIPISEVDRVVESRLVTKRGNPISLLPFSLESMYAALDSVDLQTPDLKKLDIVHYDADGTAFQVKNVYKHLIYEVPHHDRGRRNRVYIFSLGQWFRASPDHVADIEQRVATIPDVSGAVNLPAMQWIPRTDGSLRLEREDEYNERAASASDCQLFDKDLFKETLGGRSRIEVCDFLSADGRFFCVKKYEGSSDLSHLFAQGGVSADLFFNSQEYRQFTAKQIGARWALPFRVDDERPSGCKIVYAIACPEKFELPKDLPFFSKVTLLKFKRTVWPLGFKVELAKIVVPEPPAATRPRRRPRSA